MSKSSKMYISLMHCLTTNSFCFFTLLQDTDNIFSRYYVPGTLTRHKQEELGTPEAALAARRSHYVKQKQQKGKQFLNSMPTLCSSALLFCCFLFALGESKP